MIHQTCHHALQINQRKHRGQRDSSVVSAALAAVKTWIQIQLMVDPCCEYELLTFILVFAASTTRRFRKSIEYDGH